MQIAGGGIRSRARKAAPRNLSRSVRTAVDRSVLVVDWVHRGPARSNWGDAVAPRLARELSGRTVVNHRDIVNARNRPVFSTIGSMLGYVAARHLMVWGSGFVDSGSSMSCRPDQIFAVRGPLTRGRLLEQGIECPEVYGDPAALISLLYRPRTGRRYRVGLIPHFRERDLPVLQSYDGDPDILVIDICESYSQVLDQIASCDTIASGSLHGLVAADSYGIPTRWVRMSDRPFGDGFKFRDYQSGVLDSPLPAFELGPAIPVDDLVAQLDARTARLRQQVLLDSCPFIDPEVHGALTAKVAAQDACR